MNSSRHLKVKVRHKNCCLFSNCMCKVGTRSHHIWPVVRYKSIPPCSIKSRKCSVLYLGRMSDKDFHVRPIHRDSLLLRHTPSGRECSFVRDQSNESPAKRECERRGRNNLGVFIAVEKSVSGTVHTFFVQQLSENFKTSP